MSNWPALDWPAWRETALHLQLISQIVGKVRLALTPWLNHGWHVALYVTPHGLSTSLIPSARGPFELLIDLTEHRLLIRTGEGGQASIPLQQGSIAQFYEELMLLLDALGIPVAINRMPNEMVDPVAFPDDHQIRPYDREAVAQFHQAIVRIDPVFKKFRTGFLGKSSPVHFFWGSFDLAVTRFSGRLAPPHPGGIGGLPDAVTREAYSHEVSSAGFWPGSDSHPNAAFYAYAYPTPDGFSGYSVSPPQANWHEGLGEFLLDYSTVAQSDDPEGMLLQFLESTYVAAAETGNWDRAALECCMGEPGAPRQIETPF